MTDIFAHRGASGYAPENTMESFELAVEMGADGIECDVQMTNDGVAVVIHDETVDRTSSGEGLVSEMSYEQLLGFSYNNGMGKYGKCSIRRVDEVIKFAKENDILLNLEIKTEVYPYPGVERIIAKYISEYEMNEKVIISSFNHYSVEDFKNAWQEECRKKGGKLRKVETAWLLKSIMLHAPEAAVRYGVDGIHPPVTHLNNERVFKEYMDSGMPIRVWTVDDEKIISKLLDIGVRAIMSNHPDRAKRLRDDCMKKSTLKFDNRA